MVRSAAHRSPLVGHKVAGTRPCCRPGGIWLTHETCAGLQFWWHGLPSLILAGVAPLGAGFVTGNVGRWRFSLESATREEGLPLGSLVLVPGRWHSVMVVVIGKAEHVLLSEHNIFPEVLKKR